MVGEEVARVWRLYLVGGALAFEEGRMGVDQILMVKPTPRRPQRPAPRAHRLMTSTSRWGPSSARVPFTLLAVVVVLGGTFLVALRLGRHAVVDVAWGLGFAADRGRGVPRPPRAPVTGSSAVSPSCSPCVWGVRLAVHIGLRSRGHGEDPRYVELLAKAPGNPQLFALRRIYLTQGVVMWFVSLPVQVAMFEQGEANLVTLLGVLLWLVGFTFETVGDLQLTRFRNDPASQGQVLDTGPVALHPAPQLLRRRLRLVGAVPHRVQRPGRACSRSSRRC